MGLRQGAVGGAVMEQFAGIYKGRRVLVTGHTGFKGSWLALWLKRLRAEVAGFSIDVPSTPSNFALIGLDSRITHYIGDIRNRRQLAEAMDQFRPEIVFHLAAQALVRRSYADPVETFDTNVMGMVNLLDCVRTRPWIQATVLITSDKAYRNDEWCWGYRETDVLAGRDPYSGSKSCADITAQSFFHSFFRDLPNRVAIARAGNVIGGGDWAADRIVPDAIRAWSTGDSLEARNPKATRPWQHVLEPLSGYLHLGASLWEKAPRTNGEAFNFGPDAEVNQSVGQLLEEMALRWPGVRWHSPKDATQSAHEAMLLKLSCDKALFYLNWRAVLQFQETVAFTVDWYLRWHEGELSMYEYGLEQIDRYSSLAKQRGLAWVGA